MKEKLLAWGPLAALATLNPLIYVALISMIPVIELRGAIPVGIALGLPWWQVFIVAVVASTLPAPFILLFFNKFLKLLREKKWLPGLTKFLDKKFAGKENAFGISKFWGIVVFTGIPLPGTGAWTASGVASLMEMDFKQALLAVFIGNLIAGSIVTGLAVLGKTSLPLLVALAGVAFLIYLVWRFFSKSRQTIQSNSEIKTEE